MDILVKDLKKKLDKKLYESSARKKRVFHWRRI